MKAALYSRSKWMLFLLLMVQTFTIGAQQISDAWYGSYEGPLQIWKDGQLRQELMMKLELQPLVKDSNWIWHITYVIGERVDSREYQLVLIDSIPGRFRLDEKNGIVLDASLNGDKLFSRFEVNGNWIIATYRFGNDAVEFEIFSGSNTAGYSTGGVSEDIPEVLVYPLGNFQRALLRRTR